MMTCVYIGIGANLNDPKRQVAMGIEALGKLPKSQLVVASSLYISSPMGPQDQNDYINAVAKLETELAPITLLDELQSIEKTQGRIRKSERWGPRTLDLDLLLYGIQEIDETRLQVPHYGMKERAFVLLPLAEIEPNLVLPDNSQVTELIEQLEKQRIMKL